MAKQILPGIGLVSNFNSGESGWRDDMNANLVKIDALLKGSFIEIIGALPGSATVGDVYVLSTDKSINIYNSVWLKVLAKKGMTLFNEDADAMYYYNGTDWVAL